MKLMRSDLGMLRADFLRTQNDMLKLISTLSVDEVNEFNTWYTTNQDYINLQNLIANQQRR
ncbi:MAG: hypothetical protein WBP64_15135 [Nitrososphaeraceae archaeon]